MTDMYNKLFMKILDSSVWSASVETRIVWLTFIAAMDEDGMVRFASAENVAHRARVPIDAATKALEVLEGPDPNSSDQDNEGRRIERVPGGWMVLNGPKYRGLVTKSIIQEQTRERVRRHREKKAGNVTVTPVTPGNGMKRKRNAKPLAVAPDVAIATSKKTELEAEKAIEEQRLSENLTAIRDSGRDIQTVLDALPRSPSRSAFSASTWLRSGRSGFPTSGPALVALRMLNDSLEGYERAKDAPYLTENSRKSLEAIERVTRMKEHDTKREPDWARALEGVLPEHEV